MDARASKEDLARSRRELAALRRALDDDYLERSKKRVREFRTEIIIAVENIRTLGGLEP